MHMNSELFSSFKYIRFKIQFIQLQCSAIKDNVVLLKVYLKQFENAIYLIRNVIHCYSVSQSKLTCILHEIRIK